MTFLESAEKVSRLRKLQVFATDLNESLLDKARNGLNAKSLADDITPERLRRFFIEEQVGYRVCKMLREMVVFARQNLIADMLPYCQEILTKLRAAGFRAKINMQSSNIKKKIRDAQIDLVPYMLVIGAKDRDQHGVSVRDRIEGDLGFMTTEAALAKLIAERDNRVIRQSVKSTATTLAAGSDEARGNEY